MLNRHPALSTEGNSTLEATETNPKNAKHSAIHILTILWVLSIAVWYKQLQVSTRSY